MLCIDLFCDTAERRRSRDSLSAGSAYRDGVQAVSRGALRCLRLLQSYAAVSGRAFPFQSTIAAQLEVDARTVRRYVRELVAAGQLQVQKRQHSSAEYKIQTGQNVRSDVRSGVRSGVVYPYMSKRLSEDERGGGVPCIKSPWTVEEVWGNPEPRKPVASEEMYRQGVSTASVKG